MPTKCEHRKQGRTPGARYWRCLDCPTLIDGDEEMGMSGPPHGNYDEANDRVMNPLGIVAKMLVDAEELNKEVTAMAESITLMDARRLDAKIREVEGWLLGVRKVLLWPTDAPADA